MIQVDIKKKEENFQSVNDMDTGSVFIRESDAFILGDEQDRDGDYWATRLKDGIMVPIPRYEKYLVVSSVNLEVIL